MAAPSRACAWEVVAVALVLAIMTHVSGRVRRCRVRMPMFFALSWLATWCTLTLAFVGSHAT